MVRITVIVIALSLLSGCKSQEVQQSPPEKLNYSQNGSGPEITIRFQAGPEHNHPLMAIWIETMRGEFVQTIFVAESIGKGVFKHGDASSGKWLPGPIRRPAALPVWSHRRGIPAGDGLFVPDPENPVPDAYTGPTPQQDFILNARLDTSLSQFMVFIEINQPWDWNNYWTNNRFPDDEDYKTSSQPAVVYKTIINTGSENNRYRLRPVGHSHYSGDDGEINEDLSTLTTALHIAAEIWVEVHR